MAQVTKYLPLDSSYFSEIKIIESVIDVGNITQDQNVCHYHQVQNIGTVHVVMVNIKSGCECHLPDYKKQLIDPYQIAWIGGCYNPSNRPGPFNHSITFEGNFKSTPEIIRIKGNVLPDSAKSSLKIVYENPWEIPVRGTYHGTFTIENTTDSKLHVDSIVGVKIENKNKIILWPNEKQTIKYTLYSSFQGMICRTIRLHYTVDNQIQQTEVLNLFTQCVDIATYLRLDYAYYYKYPDPNLELQYDRTFYDVDTLTNYGQFEITFMFKNVGEQPVQIIDIETNNDASEVYFDWDKDEYAPGESGMIQIRFERPSSQGDFTYNYTVIAKGMMHQELKIKGYVKPE